MSDRVDWYHGQNVQESEMDTAFGQSEAALWNLIVDLQLFGVLSGLAASAGSAPNVNITSGVAYDQNGKRLKAYTDGAGTKSHSYANTTAGTATSVTAGQERWISIFARFGRKLTDPRVDGNGNPINFLQTEALSSDGTQPNLDKFYITAGASAATGTATRPALEPDKILICDIKRTPSDASNVIDTSRRQILNIPADAVTGLMVGMKASPNWAGGRTNPAPASLQVGYDKIINDLGATAASDDGAERIGAAAGAASLSSGSVRSQLDTLDTRSHMTAGLTYLGGRAFAANDSVQTLFSTLLSDLGATASSDDGAERVGAQASGNLPSGSVRSQLDWLDTNKAGLAIANSWTAIQTFQRTVILDPTTPTTTPALKSTPPADDQFNLIWLADQGNDNNGKVVPKVRIYMRRKTPTGVSDPNKMSEFWLTLNASWNGTNWTGDNQNTDMHAIVLRGFQETLTNGTTGSVLRHFWHAGTTSTFATTSWVVGAGFGYDANQGAVGGGPGGGVLLQAVTGVPGVPFSGDIILYWDGTNVKYKNSSNVVKTITAT